ncbi:unnamed protein product [Kuraishia capsulata CBS 1993]|uniref:Zn(2)-C6 fungal-type domain-containing protein n=1 Tax=Kuraishia capsulata CBS 1993 TaxID=1382522 RepID=W6MTG9_9ASCO|nr:uncharacterized protein KUCA_T00001017001 [Kuraishia capsulata CBS 1993]CDK25050.1 unnamed protein product [Kuraishia capsulata CBS 1993]
MDIFEEDYQSLDETTGGLKKRSTLACLRCRRRHIKCPGGEPCVRCTQANEPCEYMEGDRKIVISVKYLNKLQADIAQLKIENANLRTSLKNVSRDEVIEEEAPRASVDPTLNNLDHLSTPSIDDPKMMPKPKAVSVEGEVITPYLDKYGRIIHSRTGERIYVGASSMTLFGLEVNNLITPIPTSPESVHSSETPGPIPRSTETILEKEGNAYRIMLGKTYSRPGISVNFTLPSYSYAMLLVDTFVSYNDGCFYFFNEGLVKENLRRIYNDEPTLKPENYDDIKEDQTLLETMWFCKVLLIFAIGEMYLGTANSPDGYKLKNKGNKRMKARKPVPKLPGSGFFNQASELFTGLFASGAIDNCARESGIEVLLLYAFYLQVADCTVASYFYFGIALRASLVLGMHVDIGKETFNRYQLEHRRRLWWTVYMYERMLASKAGLPLSFTDDNISADLPDDFDMSNPEKNCEFYIFPEAEFIRNCVKITQINADILGRLYNRQPKSNILPVVHELVMNLLKWKKSLPEYVNCDYTQPEIQISRLVVNMMTEYFQGINLAVRPLLFHFVVLQLKSSNTKLGEYINLSKCSSVILTLINASFQASINTVRSLWALMPENMVALFGYMDREYLFTSTATLILFNAAFGVNEITREHLDHALVIFTKMRNLGNHPAALRREQLLKLLELLNFNGVWNDLLEAHLDSFNTPLPMFNESTQQNGASFLKSPSLGPVNSEAFQAIEKTWNNPTDSDVKLWNDITTEAIWLNDDFGEEFESLLESCKP